MTLWEHAKMAKHQVKIPVRELVALSFAAYRENGTLYRDSTYFDTATDSVIQVTPNKTLMMSRFLEPAAPALVPTDADYAAADTAISDIKNDILVRRLADRRVSEFAESLYNAISQEHCTVRDCGLVAFVPRTHSDMLARVVKADMVNEVARTSQFLGQVGDRVTLDFVIIDSRYVQQYNCYSVHGHDGQGNLVSFLTSKQDCAASGKILGRVKRTEASRYHNGALVTQLNFVKRLAASK